MNCEPFSTLIMKYMDGEINDVEHGQLKHHLSECNVCNKEFTELKNVMDVLDNKDVIEPPSDFEKTVMQKIELLDIYNKKLKEKKLMALYFIWSMAFTILAVLAAVLFRDNILGFMLSTGVPITVSYTIYSVLTSIGSFIELAVSLITYLKSALNDFYYLLVGLVAITFMSKFHEISLLHRRDTKAASVAKSNKN